MKTVNQFSVWERVGGKGVDSLPLTSLGPLPFQRKMRTSRLNTEYFDGDEIHHTPYFVSNLGGTK